MNLETRYNELNKDYGAYELVNIEKLNDLNSVGLLLKHKKSGARVQLFLMMMITRYFISGSVRRQRILQVYHIS